MVSKRPRSPSPATQSRKAPAVDRASWLCLCEPLDKTTEDIEGDVAQKRATFVVERAKARGLEEELRSEVEANFRLRDEHRETTIELKKVKDDLATSEIESNKKDVELEQLKKEIVTSRAKIIDIGKENDSCKIFNDDLLEKVREREERVQSLLAQMKPQDQKVESVLAQVSEKNTRINCLLAEVSYKNSEIERLQRKVNDVSRGVQYVKEWRNCVPAKKSSPKQTPGKS